MVMMTRVLRFDADQLRLLDGPCATSGVIRSEITMVLRSEADENRLDILTDLQGRVRPRPPPNSISTA
jgi:hypothetical protein